MFSLKGKCSTCVFHIFPKRHMIAGHAVAAVNPFTSGIATASFLKDTAFLVVESDKRIITIVIPIRRQRHLAGVYATTMCLIFSAFEARAARVKLVAHASGDPAHL